MRTPQLWWTGLTADLWVFSTKRHMLIPVQTTSFSSVVWWLILCRVLIWLCDTVVLVKKQKGNPSCVTALQRVSSPQPRHSGRQIWPRSSLFILFIAEMFPNWWSYICYLTKAAANVCVLLTDSETLDVTFVSDCWLDSGVVFHFW